VCFVDVLWKPHNYSLLGMMNSWAQSYATCWVWWRVELNNIAHPVGYDATSGSTLHILSDMVQGSSFCASCLGYTKVELDLAHSCRVWCRVELYHPHQSCQVWLRVNGHCMILTTTNETNETHFFDDNQHLRRRCNLVLWWRCPPFWTSWWNV